MTARRPRRGRLVAFEGIDGVGKSTLVRSLAQALRRRGLSVAVRREPADPGLGQLAQAASLRDPWTGAVYFTLDRYLAKASVERDLAHYDVVLTDRSLYSTLAYQGSALPPTALRRLEKMQIEATREPDQVIWIDLPPGQALARLGRRGRRRAPLERAATLERVASAYRRLARRHRWHVLDGRTSPKALVAESLRLVAPPSPGRARPRRPTRR